MVPSMNGSRGGEPAKIASVTMLVLGAAALALSILYAYSLLAFIGLGLTFWGAIILYIRPEDYTKKAVLDASILPSLTTLEQIVRELGFKGDVTYLPPKYFEDPDTTRIYVAKREGSNLPAPEQIETHENQLIVKNPQGMLLTPPGLELTRLLEKTTKTSFTKVDVKYLQENMPKLFVEDLEIAENLDIQIENDTVRVTITNSVFNEAPQNKSELHVIGKIGTPLCSAIACALTKASGRPVMIEDIHPSADGKTTEITYQIIQMTEPEEQAKTSPPPPPPQPLYSRRTKATSAFLIIFGSAVLSLIGIITWQEMTLLGKSITQIFLGSRAGETMSLGLDMRLVYYFAIALALLLAGLITLVRGRKRENTRSTLSDRSQPPVQGETLQ
jgi:hypothetical protein